MSFDQFLELSHIWLPSLTGICLTVAGSHYYKRNPQVLQASTSFGMAARAAGLGLVLSGSLIGLLTTAAYLHLGVSEWKGLQKRAREIASASADTHVMQLVRVEDAIASQSRET